MNPERDDSTDLETAMRAVYRGALEEFIARRDALVKDLRADKRPDDAAQVKALRKPGRMAWALDQVVLNDPAPVEQLAAAIAATQSESGRSGDIRQTMEGVRAAARAVAQAGNRMTIRAGHPIQTSSLVAAVQAVIGDAAAFAKLRAGRLTDIPEGGGLDILAAVAAATPARAMTVASRKPAVAEETELAAPARAELQTAETSLAEARARAQSAQQAELSAQGKLDDAERKLQHARDQAEILRAELERFRKEAESAAAQISRAEQKLAKIRDRLRAGA